MIIIVCMMIFYLLLAFYMVVVFMQELVAFTIYLLMYEYCNCIPTIVIFIFISHVPTVIL